MNEAASGRPKVDVAVVVVAFQSGAYLQRCLDALAAQTVAPAEILVIDNASKDGAPQAARLPDGARLVRFEENVGFAAANNRAAGMVATRWLALLNPDAFAEPGWLAALVAAGEAHPEAAAFAALQFMDAEPSRLDGAGDVVHACGVFFRGGYGRPAPASLPEGEVFAACAAAGLYRREVFLAAGGFDERFFCYCEDVDLSYRLRLYGWRVRLAPKARVRHVGSASSGRRSDFAVRHGTRNRLWTLVKNTPLALAPLVAALHAAALSLLLLRDIIRAPREAQATFAGLRQALGGLGPMLAARRGVQRRRTVSTLAIARALCWSPLTLAKRAADIRPDQAQG